MPDPKTLRGSDAGSSISYKSDSDEDDEYEDEKDGNSNTRDVNNEP